MPDNSEPKTYALFASPHNRNYISTLEKTGAAVITFPPPLAAAEILTAAQTKILANITDFDWIIFPDIYAVEFFSQWLETRGIDAFQLDDIRICACGEAVSDALRFRQIHADVIPTRLDDKSISAALTNFNGELKGLKILFVSEANDNSNLAQSLINSGCALENISLYRMTPTENSALARSKALLKGGAIDEFVFTSPLEATNLKYIFKRENLAELFDEIKVSASDQITFQSLRELGLKPILHKKTKTEN